MRDNLRTVVAIGLAAYVIADIAHHAFGHAGLCWWLGGRIELLSSVFVRCSRTGMAVDLAGPLGNLGVGLIALLILRAAQGLSAAAELFYILLAAFNLMWFSIHLIFSVLTGSDDWALLLHAFNDTPLARYSLAGAGVLAYVITARVLRSRLAPFARPPSRAYVIVVAAWLSAGAIACATAAFDSHGVAVIWREALPQSMLLSIGLLFLPDRARRTLRPLQPPAEAPAIGLSWGWLAAAVVLCIVSIAFLGPGIGFKPPL